MVVNLKTFNMYHLQGAWSAIDTEVFVVLQFIISLTIYKVLWWPPKTTVMCLVHLFSFKPKGVCFFPYLGRRPPCSWLSGENRWKCVPLWRVGGPRTWPPLLRRGRDSQAAGSSVLQPVMGWGMGRKAGLRARGLHQPLLCSLGSGLGRRPCGPQLPH